MLEVENLVQELASLLKKKQWFVTTAESCTGGGLASAMTSISGSSLWFDRGFVSYSNDAKQEMLGVHAETLERFGAVSEETVKEMAQGALRHSHAQLSIAITGIAGPTGGSKEKPVGLVWFGICDPHFVMKTYQKIFDSNRHEIRLAATNYALNILIDHLKNKP